MKSMILTVGRPVIAATLLSLSLSAFANDASQSFFQSKAPKSIPVTSTTAPAAYPESWSERVRQARNPELAPGQGEGRNCEPVLGDKAARAMRLAQGGRC